MKKKERRIEKDENGLTIRFGCDDAKELLDHQKKEQGREREKKKTSLRYFSSTKGTR